MNRKISQTEFYYLREKVYRSNEIYDFEKKKLKKEPFSVLENYLKNDAVICDKSILNSKKNVISYLDNNFNSDYCRYVFLKPNKIKKKSYPELLAHLKGSETDFFEKLNSWSNNSFDNPWISFTYEDLASVFERKDSLKNNLDQYKTNKGNDIIAKGYIEYIKENFQQDIDLNNFNNNKFGKFDYFKLLMKLVKSKFVSSSRVNSISKVTEDYVIHEYLESGSSNGGMPLFAFYKKIKIDERFLFFDKKRNYINVGVQVQGNILKYYVSADSKDYNDTKIKEIYSKEIDNQLSYGKFVKSLLHWVTDSVVDFPATHKGFNPNKTKTFYSRSYKIVGFINEKKEMDFNPRNIFDIATEISEKVNNCLNLEMQKQIDILLNEIK